MEPWLQLLLQVPLVGVFIWYSLEMNRRAVEAQTKANEQAAMVQAKYFEALDKRDAEFERRNTAVIGVIDKLNSSICTQMEMMDRKLEEHDRYVREMQVPAMNKVLIKHDEQARQISVDLKNHDVYVRNEVAKKSKK